MFGDAARELASWLEEACPDVDVVLEPPDGATDRGPRLHAFLLHLSDLSRRSERRLDDRSGPSSRYETARATLRFVIAVTGDLAAPDAHDLLGCAFVAAGDRAEVTVASDPLPLALWQAYGVSPRPALVLDVRVASEQRVPEDISIVREVDLDARADHGASGRRPGPRSSHDGRTAPESDATGDDPRQGDRAAGGPTPDRQHGSRPSAARATSTGG